MNQSLESYEGIDQEFVEVKLYYLMDELKANKSTLLLKEIVRAGNAAGHGFRKHISKVFVQMILNKDVIFDYIKEFNFEIEEELEEIMKIYNKRLRQRIVYSWYYRVK